VSCHLVESDFNRQEPVEHGLVLLRLSIILHFSMQTQPQHMRGSGLLASCRRGVQLLYDSSHAKQALQVRKSVSMNAHNAEVLNVQ
jgi:hypothetical protein